MGKRLRLGFVYLWDESWLGGVYYTHNLIKALNTLPEGKKPIIHFYCLNDKAFDDIQLQTHYPYIEKIILKRSLGRRVYRRAVRLFSVAVAERVNIYNLDKNDDMVYPLSEGSIIPQKVYWHPDFQEKHLPELFTNEEIAARDNIIKRCFRLSIPIVFSSYDSQKDFHSFYPQYIIHPTYVVHFAANLDDFSDVDIDIVKKKYNINKPYLLCANQFWKHKNHLFLFRAFHRALREGLDMQLVCTGRMSDYRNPNYIDEIKTYIFSNHLEMRVLTLGMIEKKELLCLMKNSYAVVQPSLFEGWNTTVEDCKAMSKFVYLSDLSVHREQLDRNVCFFDPHDENDLANKLLTVKPEEVYYDYSNNVKKFGEEFLHVMEKYWKNRL